MAFQGSFPFVDTTDRAPNKQARSGSFVDNMALPVHRWFRYSAGFSGEWVCSLLAEFQDGVAPTSVFDPFAGSGTTLIAADTSGVPSTGIEAHPFVARIARAKLLWCTSVDDFVERSEQIVEAARHVQVKEQAYPKLMTRCFSDKALAALWSLRSAWQAYADDSDASELTWLALTAILRRSSAAGTAQWQYILPNKSKVVVEEPIGAFLAQVQMMRDDMLLLQARATQSQAAIIQSDARNCPTVPAGYADLVVTSPPYANNYDYADATRFEMTFWGEVEGWSDLHPTIRRHLIVSSSQHASAEKLDLNLLLDAEEVRPIHAELSVACKQLEAERESHGGKKHYHTMIAAYFRDMSLTWRELRRICRPGARAVFVIGDSAPYGIYVPVDQWLGELALAAGFRDYQFAKLRDRNTKWKNRKHRVPLHEGLLTVQG